MDGEVYFSCGSFLLSSLSSDFMKSEEMQLFCVEKKKKQLHVFQRWALFDRESS